MHSRRMGNDGVEEEEEEDVFIFSFVYKSSQSVTMTARQAKSCGGAFMVDYRLILILREGVSLSSLLLLLPSNRNRPILKKRKNRIEQ